MKTVFFGTDEFAVTVLDQLKQHEILPQLIITTPDRPRGRGLHLSPSSVKVWAESQALPYQQPEDLNNFKLEKNDFDLFIIASYGKIIPSNILDWPKHGVLNVHPSLLPLYRGATPIQSAILGGEKETGVTIMLVDEKMDHGPILIQKTVPIAEKNYLELRGELAKIGADLLAEVISRWVASEIKSIEQNHRLASYTKKINKTDGEIDLTTDPILNFRKFRAFTPKPGIYFFQNGQRIKITDARLENNQFIIKKVIPEGKSEMIWKE